MFLPHHPTSHNKYITVDGSHECVDNATVYGARCTTPTISNDSILCQSPRCKNPRDHSLASPFSIFSFCFSFFLSCSMRNATVGELHLLISSASPLCCISFGLHCAQATSVLHEVSFACFSSPARGSRERRKRCTITDTHRQQQQQGAQGA